MNTDSNQKDGGVIAAETFVDTIEWPVDVFSGSVVPFSASVIHFPSAGTAFSRKVAKNPRLVPSFPQKGTTAP